MGDPGVGKTGLAYVLFHHELNFSKAHALNLNNTGCVLADCVMVIQENDQEVNYSLTLRLILPIGLFITNVIATTLIGIVTW